MNQPTHVPRHEKVKISDTLSFQAQAQNVGARYCAPS